MSLDRGQSAGGQTGKAWPEGQVGGVGGGINGEEGGGVISELTSITDHSRNLHGYMIHLDFESGGGGGSCVT